MTSNQKKAAEIMKPHMTSRLAAMDLAKQLEEAGLLTPDNTTEEEDYRVIPFDQVEGKYVTSRYIRRVTPWEPAPMLTHGQKKTAHDSDDHTGLPEPSRTMFPSGQAWYLKGPVGDVRAVPGSVVAFGLWEEQPFRIVTTPEEAIELARTLTAAAHHARETTPQTIPAEQAGGRRVTDTHEQEDHLKALEDPQDTLEYRTEHLEGATGTWAPTERSGKWGTRQWAINVAHIVSKHHPSPINRIMARRVSPPWRVNP